MDENTVENEEGKKKFNLKAFVVENKKQIIKKAVIVGGAVVGLGAVAALTSYLRKNNEPAEVLEAGFEAEPSAVEPAVETPQE